MILENLLYIILLIFLEIIKNNLFKYIVFLDRKKDLLKKILTSERNILDIQRDINFTRAHDIRYSEGHINGQTYTLTENFIAHRKDT
jgi:hypothetical protein